MYRDGKTLRFFPYGTVNFCLQDKGMVNLATRFWLKTLNCLKNVFGG